VDLDFCEGESKVKLRFLCVGGFMTLCEAHSEMQSMSLLGGSGGMPPRKALKNACSEIESGAF